jgi:O-antigen/teichoic acid export membrane protein
MALGPSMVIIPIFFAYHGIASGINLFLIILIIVLSASMPWIVTKIRALPKQQTGHGSAVRAVAGYAAPLTIAAIIDIVAKLLAPFYLAAVRSTEDVGAWSTGRNLMGPVQVILIGLANSAIPLARGGYAKDGRRGAIHETIILARWMIPLYLIPLALIFWWAPAIIGIVFGVVYEGSDTILRIYCIAYLIMGANTLFSSLLTALGSVRQQVVVSILSAVIYLGGLPFALAHWGGVGVAGMAIAGEISSLCVLIVYYFCYHRGPPEPRTYIHG